jgi:hypothetical protein
LTNFFQKQPGNYIGSFEKNVLPAFDDDQKSRASVEKATEEIAQENYSDQEYEAFAERILKHHNEFRKRHHAPDLK